MILTVTMNPSIDTRYQLDKLIIDDVNRVTPEKTAGGKGLNVSRVLLQLGDDVLATGLLGGHMGAYMAELMDADGVKNDFVPIAGETRICLNILHEGNQTELLESGPQIAPAELEAFTTDFRSAWEWRWQEKWIKKITVFTPLWVTASWQKALSGRAQCPQETTSWTTSVRS